MRINTNISAIISITEGAEFFIRFYPETFFRL